MFSTEAVPLPDQARLHEKAVQAVANGEVEPPKRKRTRGKGKPKSSKVRSNASVYDDMHPEVAEKVRSLKPDLRHVQVVTPTNVVIWNHPAPWPLQVPPPPHPPQRRRVMGTTPKDSVTVPIVEDS